MIKNFLFTFTDYNNDHAQSSTCDRLVTLPSKVFFSLRGEEAVEELLLLLLTSKAWPDWDLGREASEGEAVLEQKLLDHFFDRF